MIARSPKDGPYRIHCPEETTLQQIADALGVSTNAFNTGLKTHLFFTDPDGSEWFLFQEPISAVRVRRVRAQTVEQDAREPPPNDTTIAEFFAKNWNEPQGQALAAIIESLLKAHLSLSAERLSD
ncbi:hypothetical protein ACFQE0_25080 [Methylobacterium komagatae]|uniref:HTH cro/C1-type domain-containing protein n=1 Tax=Methylobacterium komagatae TaxID=374425 RepID=A0ABW2BQM8_9HYPH